MEQKAAATTEQSSAVGFVEVTEEQFFARVGPLNVHPRPAPEASIWEMCDGSRAVIGRSEPGYKNHGAPKRYWLKGGAA